MATIKRKVKRRILKTRRTQVGEPFGAKGESLYHVTWVEGKTGKKTYERIWAKTALKAIRRARVKLGARKIKRIDAKLFRAEKMTHPFIGPVA